MSDDLRVKKSGLIQLLDMSQEFEQAVFNHFDGERYSASDEFMKVNGIKKIFELLIPKTTWTKEDFTKKSNEISISGVQPDADGNVQLIINLNDVDHAFMTTSEAVNQLFTPDKMNQYAKYMLENSNDHLPMLLTNFDYWFNQVHPEAPILIRTVVENGSRIARCFATPAYKPIDNHVLLYISLWALEQLDMKFYLSLYRIDHSSMKLDFVSDEEINLGEIGKLSYGFTLVNSESKEKTVGFYPTFDLTNRDGTSATLIMDKPITIVHRGRSLTPIIEKLQEIKDIKKHLDWVVEVIKLAHKTKIDDIFAFRVQQEIIRIIGVREFGKFSSSYTEISSNNTYNLLQFFGRLDEMDVPDEDEAIKIKVMFWKFLEKYKKDQNQN